MLNGKEIYKANGPCMYGFSPCSNQKIDFYILDKFNYYFLLKNKINMKQCMIYYLQIIFI